jgi:DNA-binding winged helix-turn-helix (wHTH) protein/TolB-like protein/Flp pilus assembly protein TadD
VKPEEIKRSYEFGPFRLDPEERTLSRSGELVPLTIKAFETLLVLVENAGHLLPKDELMRRVWPETVVEENNLAQQISFLRKALGEPETGVKYIETLPKRGYRFLSTPSLVSDDSVGLIVRETIRGRVLVEEEVDDDSQSDIRTIHTTTEVSLPAPARQSMPRRKQSAIALTCLGLLVLAGAAYLLYHARLGRRRPSAGTRTLAIMPFRNLKGDSETDFLGLSLADAIITKLGYVSTVIVRPSSYVEKYRNQEIDPKKIGEELNVNTLLTGTFMKEGDELRIKTQLVDLESNEILWRDTIDLKYDKVLLVEDRVAREIIGGMKLKLSPVEDQHITLDAPRDPLAYEYYLRGVDLYTRNDFPMAVEMFRKSVSINANYAQAWAHLGTAYTAVAAFRFGGQEDYQKALAAYRKALELNPDQIEARIFMANMFTDTNQASQAVPLLREVLRTNPNYALAHWELGYAYRFAGLLDESIKECEQARALDPQVKLRSSALNGYLYSGQYEKFLRSLPPDEDVAFVVFYRGLANLYLKDNKAATASFERAYQLDASLYTQIGKALSYAINAKRPEGLELLKATEAKMKERGVTDPEAMYKIAQAYALLGDKPAALRMLSQSINGGFFCYPYVKDDPLLNSIRDQADYGVLLEMARKGHEEFRSRFMSETSAGSRVALHYAMPSPRVVLQVAPPLFPAELFSSQN